MKEDSALAKLVWVADMAIKTMVSIGSVAISSTVLAIVIVKNGIAPFDTAFSLFTIIGFGIAILLFIDNNVFLRKIAAFALLLIQLPYWLVFLQSTTRANVILENAGEWPVWAHHLSFVVLAVSLIVCIIVVLRDRSKYTSLLAEYQTPK